MKKIIPFFLAVALCFSCADSRNLPRRMDQFVAQTEASADYMTEKDWEISTSEYETMVEEFVENYDSYTKEERQAVYEAIGRYNGLLVKQGLDELQIQTNEFMKNLNQFIDELPDALNGLLEGFASGFESE